jgi:hypothetical protein
MKRALGGTVIAAIGAAGLATLILGNELWHSRVLVWLVWLTSAPVLLIAELCGRWLQHLGFFSAPPSQWDALRFGVYFVSSLLWIVMVFCPLLYKIRSIGGSVVWSQVFVLVMGSAISAALPAVSVYVCDTVVA